MPAYDFILCGGDILLRRYRELRDTADELEELRRALVAEGAPGEWVTAVIHMIEYYRSDAKQVRYRFERLGYIEQNFSRRAS